MGTNHWDNSGFSPDLSRLPPEVREGLNKAIPHRPDECHAAVMIFRQSAGLNHPNGRCNIACYVQQPNSAVAMDAGLQLDFAEYTGRIPLMTAIVDMRQADKFVAGLLRAYMKLGGDVRKVIEQAELVRPVDERVVFFEERNDE